MCGLERWGGGREYGEGMVEVGGWSNLEEWCGVGLVMVVGYGIVRNVVEEGGVFGKLGLFGFVVV
ncbi:hypothetical protein GJV44_00194 [Candidatus Vallotia cooleyia]|nr:hypothetical protein GJV44_00194 [Candidatus Vallotia cooleyia]